MKQLTQGVIAVTLVALTGCSNPVNPVTVRFGPTSVTTPPGTMLWVTLVVLGCAAIACAGITIGLMFGWPNNARGGSWHWWTKRWRIASRAIFVVSLSGAAAAYAALRLGLLGNSILLAGSSVGLATGLPVASMLRRRRLDDLLSTGETRSLSEWGDLLSDRDALAREYAVVMFAKTLPNLSAEQLIDFDSKIRRTLYRHLSGTDPILSRAVLSVVRTLEDCQALPDVERLVRQSESFREDDPLRCSAVECVEFLRRKEAEFRDSRFLVRPAEPQIAPDVSLLRPAGSHAAESSVLLRPVRPDEGGEK